MNARSIVILVLAFALPIVGCVLSIWMTSPSRKIAGRLPAVLPFLTWIACGQLITLAAVVAGHPEWNVDSSTHSTGVMDGWRWLYMSALAVPVIVATIMALDIGVTDES